MDSADEVKSAVALRISEENGYTRPGEEEISDE